MQEALKEALKAYRAGEVPVGAVVVYKNKIIARAHNQMITLKDPTAHAEMIAITQSAGALMNERLSGSVLYVTIEPCVMCAGASVMARLNGIVYGAAEPKFGGCDSVFCIPTDERLNHRVDILSGVMGDECASIIRAFFAKRRAGRLESLGGIWCSPGFTDEWINLYAAFDLEQVPQRLEDDEVIELHEMPFSRALDMVWSGQIPDAKSALALLKAARLLSPSAP